MKRLPHLAWLTVLWVLLWRDLSVGNLLSGLAIAAVVTVAYPLSPLNDTNQRLRIGRLVSFVLYFLWQVLTANLVVARAVLSPRDRIVTGIVAVPLPGCSDLVTTVVANSLTLTPGTLTVEVRRDPRTIYLHVLHVKDIEEVRQSMYAMARQALRALATEEAQSAFETAISERSVPGGTAADGPAPSEEPA